MERYAPKGSHPHYHGGRCSSTFRLPVKDHTDRTPSLITAYLSYLPRIGLFSPPRVTDNHNITPRFWWGDLAWCCEFPTSFVGRILGVFCSMVLIKFSNTTTNAILLGLVYFEMCINWVIQNYRMLFTSFTYKSLNSLALPNEASMLRM
jgi:hypothetical protein